MDFEDRLWRAERRHRYIAAGMICAAVLSGVSVLLGAL